MRQEIFSKAKRIVIKVGTSVLTGSKGELDKDRIAKLVDEVYLLLQKNVKGVLVTSGAIGAGMGLLKLRVRPKSLPRLQAAAAIGQSELMHTYDELFRAKGFLAAQVLLTQEDFVDRRRYLNARNTMLTLLECGAVPIVNENDTVSVDEIKLGDNDRLSGLVANLLEADLLIILTDTEGLYSYSKETKTRELIKVVDEVTPEVERLAGGTKGELSVGGMATKVEAAKIATTSGIAMVVADGRADRIITRLMNGEELGTLFLPKIGKMQAKKRWLAFTARPRGKIVVDEGAKEALVSKGKSLLASGIVNSQESFKVGDVVSIADKKGKEFARGLVNYSADEIDKIKGLSTGQIESTLGYKYYDEVVHRDNMVIL